MIPFLKSFRERYGRQSEEIVADSGYGNEQNYAYMDGEGMDAYVKYTMFHAEMKQKYRNNAFIVQNMYNNEEKDFYVCPMGQHLDRAGTRSTVSDLGYRSSVASIPGKELQWLPSSRNVATRGSPAGVPLK